MNRKTTAGCARSTAALVTTLAALGLGAAPALAASSPTADVSANILTVVGSDDSVRGDVLTVSSPSAGVFVIADANVAVTTSSTGVCGPDPATPTQVICTAPDVTRIAIAGGTGRDTLTNDTSLPSTMNGGSGDDILFGGAGNDAITGALGYDTIDGRGGNDVISVNGTFLDKVTCGTGNDTANVDDSDQVAADCEKVVGRTAPGPTGAGTLPDSGPVQVFPQLTPGACDIAHTISGTPGPDSLMGTTFGDLMFGLAGNDVLSGLAGDDCLFGAAGKDLLDGSVGNDFLKGDFGNDRLKGGAGTDRLAGDRGADVISAGGGDDLVAAGNGKDKVVGGSGNDSLSGGAGRDRLSGGSGGDRINAADGVRDLVRCGKGRDVVRADRVDRVAGSCEKVSRR